MKKNKIILASVVIAIIAAFFFTFNRGQPSAKNTSIPRVSWMTSWATTGQIMTALKNTNINDIVGLNAEYPSFVFGPAMNEAALGGKVDVTNTGIVPTINLLAASDDWVVVARLIDFPVSLVVANDAEIDSLNSLIGKRIAVPFGGGSHPYIIERLNEKNIPFVIGKSDPSAVQLVNVTPPDQANVFRTNEVDAVATWEPQTSISLSARPSSILDQDVHTGFISIRRSFAEQNRESVVKLLEAYLWANLYVAKNRDLTDEWFMQVSSMPSDILNRIEVIEKNLQAKSIDDISLNIGDAEIKKTQLVANIMYSNGLIKNKVKFSERVDISYLNEAVHNIEEEDFDLIKLNH